MYFYFCKISATIALRTLLLTKKKYFYYTKFVLYLVSIAFHKVFEKLMRMISKSCISFHFLLQC